MLNFGKIIGSDKHVCFDVPNPGPNINIPKINFPKLTLPTPPNIPGVIKDFGKKLANELKSVETALSKLKPPGIPIKKLNFGLPDLSSLGSMIKGIKVPKTICITVGGDFGVSSVLDQLTNGIKNITTPKIPIILPPLPDLSGLHLPSLTSLVPGLNGGPVIQVDKSLEQILSETKDRCTNLLLAELDALDPTTRLQQLIKMLQALCGSLQFSKMQDLINRIQQAKAELVRSAIDSLTSPLDKLAKLHDMSIDAINTGANDILEEIGRLADALTFEQMLTTLNGIDPANALRMLNAAIKQQAQLQNFDAIKKLLAGVNYLKSLNQTINNFNVAILDAPENFLNALQAKINELVDLEQYDEIQKFLALHDAFKQDAIDALRNLSPGAVLKAGAGLLNDALRKLDIGEYNRILDQMANILCPQGLSSTIGLPNIPGFNPLNGGL